MAYLRRFVAKSWPDKGQSDATSILTTWGLVMQMDIVELGPVTTKVVDLVTRLADRMQSQVKFKATAELQLLAMENEYRPAFKATAPVVIKPFSYGERSEQDDLASLRSALYASKSA